MSFAHPLLLALVLLPAIWAVATLRTSPRPLALIAKVLSVALIVLAFAEPGIQFPQLKNGAVVLVDTSQSITSADLARASSIAEQIEKGRGSNWLRVVPFDSRTRALLPSETAAGLHLGHAARSDSESGTDLEAALTGSMAMVPDEFAPRLVLISDGNENQGSAARAIAQLQRVHVPVDTIPLAGSAVSNVRLDSVALPKWGYEGEAIPIDLNLYSPSSASADVELSADGKLLGRQQLLLKSGSNMVRLHARLKSTGVITLSGRIDVPGLGGTDFEEPIELRRAKVLYISQDPADTDNNLLAAFKQADFDIARDWRGFDDDPGQYGLVTLNNLDLNAFPLNRKAALEQYVKNGGGLLLIGGERQVYKEDKKFDALDRALPAKLAPPDTPKGTCVALIVDKSSSMEGRKIELARLSAIGVVEHLRPIDSIGVLMFDNSYQWAVPMRHAEDKPLIKRLISGITPDGGTQIAPALAEAYRRVLPSKASFKHIVLLTDGISEEGDSVDLAKEALEHQVTISTVGLGQDVNRSYLEKIAAASGGRSYFLNEPMGLEQILLKDVETFSGSTAVEKSLTPIVVQPADVLEGVGMETAPALKGYARFVAMRGAEVPLEIDAVRKDPLYVRWQYGLGRAAVFTSDAKSRWAEAWVSWTGFDKFWINVSRDLLAHTDHTEAAAAFDAVNGDLTVRYQLAGRGIEPQNLPAIYVLGANGLRKTVPIERISPGLYAGRVHIGSGTGLLRVRPVNESSLFPEIGLYRPHLELKEHGANETLLREISASTGGRYNPAPDTVLNSKTRTSYVTWRLWPLCLAFALALTVGELITRKWNGVSSFLRRIS
jgi:Mg-chelatase subunit ChlD